MKTIAFLNHKGGVGKTACSLAFAQGLARAGKCVLLVDLDQQMNATQSVGITDTEGMPTAYDMLLAGRPANEVVREAPFGFIAPGDVLLADAEAELSSLDTPLMMLKDSLESINDGYTDYCVIDCPPSLGYVTRNAMVAADELVIVVQPDEASITGFGRIWKAYERIKSNKHLNPNLLIVGILLNGFDWNRKLSKRVVRELPEFAKDYGTRMFDTKIRNCEAVRQAQADPASVTVYDYAPNCNAARDFNDFVSEYLELEGRAV